MISDVARAEFQAQGYTLLSEYSERDLVRRDDGVCVPAGRVTEGVWPEGAENFPNPRHNLWWARGPNENVVLVCLDPRHLK